MKKRNLIIIGSILGILIIVVAVFAVLNAGNIGEKKELEADKTIIIKSADNEIGKADMDFIISAGQKEFTAIMDTSKTGPKEHSFTGVLLKDVLEKMGINIDDYTMFTVKAIDGYTVAFENGEVKDDDNIYIAYKMDGKELGTKASGGNGPYQVIVRKDQFSQRWCKFVVEINLAKQ